MSSTRSPRTYYEDTTPPLRTPFYAESPEISRQLFKATTTPSPNSPRTKRRRRQTTVISRSQEPSPEEQDFSDALSNSPSHIAAQLHEADDVFSPSSQKSSPQIPSGFGLGLGIPVHIPSDATAPAPGHMQSDHHREPLIAWRFSDVSTDQQSSSAYPSSPSPTESIAGDPPTPPGDESSIYTLTPGPAWPPPASSDGGSADPTPRNSLDAKEVGYGGYHYKYGYKQNHGTSTRGSAARVGGQGGQGGSNRGSGGSTDFEDVPPTPLTPAISQLLQEISSIERPAGAPVQPRGIRTVQAWVYDMPVPDALGGVGRGRGQRQIRPVRKMRSWRNLRALGTRTSQFELLRREAEGLLPSPPITPPGDGEINGDRDETEEEDEEEEEERRDVRIGSAVAAAFGTPVGLPDSPVEYPFYDEYEDITDDYMLDPAMVTKEERDSESGEEIPFVMVLDDGKGKQIVNQWQPQQQQDEESEEEEEEPAETLYEKPPQLPHMRKSVDESPIIPRGMIDPTTPDPNLDLVDQIEALLQSSPLRKIEREEAERAASNQSTPTQANVAEGSGAFTYADPERTPTQIHAPAFNRNATNDTIGSETSVSTVFYTPKEGRTPFVELSNPLEKHPLPPLPVEKRPQTPPPKASTQSSSSQSTPTRPPIPVRRSSLSHSRNGSTESVPQKSYPPGSYRPAHIRGKSIDSSIQDSRGRNYPPVALRQRSSSANAATEDAVRGRGRSRSIDDGPPPIPARKSSVGKTGKPSQLLDRLIRRDGSSEAEPRPSLGSLIGGRKVSDDSVETEGGRRFSFSSGQEILGTAEIVSAGVVPGGSVKEVLVRTGSNATRPAEFPEIAVTSPPLEAQKLDKGKAKATEEFKPAHVPQFSFGAIPDLSFMGKQSTDSPPTTAEKGKARAVEPEPEPIYETVPIPPRFQLIPPTPAATETSATATRQLGYNTNKPLPMPIPGTPPIDSVVSTGSPRPQHYLYRHGTPPVKIISANDVIVHDLHSSTPSIPLPPPMPIVTQDSIERRPSTAPEPLIDFENTTPSVGSSSHGRRPSLKNRPTGFKKSKLSPWWKPKYPSIEDYGLYDYGDEYDYLPRHHHHHHDSADGGRRPATSGAYIGSTMTTTTVIGGPGIAGGQPKKKKHRTLSLGKVQLEFVGVKGLRESYREMKEDKKRRKREQMQARTNAQVVYLDDSAGNATGVDGAASRSRVDVGEERGVEGSKTEVNGLHESGAGSSSVPQLPELKLNSSLSPVMKV